MYPPTIHQPTHPLIHSSTHLPLATTHPRPHAPTPQPIYPPTHPPLPQPLHRSTHPHIHLPQETATIGNTARAWGGLVKTGDRRRYQSLLHFLAPVAGTEEQYASPAENGLAEGWAPGAGGYDGAAQVVRCGETGDK